MLRKLILYVDINYWLNTSVMSRDIYTINVGKYKNKSKHINKPRATGGYMGVVGWQHIH